MLQWSRPETAYKTQLSDVCLEYCCPSLFAVVWKRYRERVNSLEFRVELLKMEVSGWAIIRFLLSPASSCPLHTTTAYHRERHHFETSSIAPCCGSLLVQQLCYSTWISHLAMIPLSTLSPIKRQLSNNRPQPLDPGVLRFSRLFCRDTADETVTCLRQIVDVHRCTAEVEALLSELEEVDSSSGESSDEMEWSFSQGEPPRSKVCYE